MTWYANDLENRKPFKYIQIKGALRAPFPPYKRTQMVFASYLHLIHSFDA